MGIANLVVTFISTPKICATKTHARPLFLSQNLCNQTSIFPFCRGGPGDRLAILPNGCRAIDPLPGRSNPFSPTEISERASGDGMRWMYWWL
jgi:hypothetical protein